MSSNKNILQSIYSFVNIIRVPRHPAYACFDAALMVAKRYYVIYND